MYAVGLVGTHIAHDVDWVGHAEVSQSPIIITSSFSNVVDQLHPLYMLVSLRQQAAGNESYMVEAEGISWITKVTLHKFKIKLKLIILCSNRVISSLYFDKLCCA